MNDITDVETPPVCLEIEKIAWFKGEQVTITLFQEGQEKILECFHYRDIVKVLEQEKQDTIGTFLVLGMGMVLASYQSMQKDSQKLEFLNQAAYELSHVDSKNVNEKAYYLEECLKEGLDATEQNQSMTDAMLGYVRRDWEKRIQMLSKMADSFLEVTKPGQQILLIGLDEYYAGILIWRSSIKKIKLSFTMSSEEIATQNRILQITDELKNSFSAAEQLTILTMQKEEKIQLALVQGELIARNGSTKVKEGIGKLVQSTVENKVPLYIMGIPSQDLYSGRDFKLEDSLYEQVLMPSKITEIISDRGRYRPEYLEGSFDEYNSEFY